MLSHVIMVYSGILSLHLDVEKSQVEENFVIGLDLLKQRKM